MRIRWTIVGLGLPIAVIAACSSDDDAREGAGQLATGGGSNVDGAAGATGASGGAAGSQPFNQGAAVSCSSSADCVTSAYVAPIDSVGDCYCAGCPTVPLNVTTADERLAAWETHCASWSPPGVQGCTPVKCTAPPESVCTDGVCTLID
jgi:hypothetical protein